MTRAEDLEASIRLLHQNGFDIQPPRESFDGVNDEKFSIAMEAWRKATSND